MGLYVDGGNLHHGGGGSEISEAACCFLLSCLSITPVYNGDITLRPTQNIALPHTIREHLTSYIAALAVQPITWLRATICTDRESLLNVMTT